MTTRLNKFCALLTLALLGAGSLGCSYDHVRYDGTGDNVPFAKSEHTYPEDGFQDRKRPYVFRIGLDARGSIYPDPARCRIDDREFEASGCLLENYFAGREGYDPEEVVATFAQRINAQCSGGKSLVILVHGMDIRGTLAQFYLRLHSFLKTGIRELRRKGSVRGGPDPAFVAWGLIGLGTLSTIQRELALESPATRKRILLTFGKRLLET